MRKLSYLAVLEPNGAGEYWVYFPDLPGCVSHGKTFEDAKCSAEEALELHIYGMEKSGDTIPEPSKSPKIDPETAPGFLVSDVTIYPDMVRNELDNKRVKTNTTLPAWLKSAAEQKGVNFSRLLESSLIEYMDIHHAH